MSKDADINLICRQCSRQFVFSKAEQEFYELKDFTSPSRCQECRSAKQNEPYRFICSQCGTGLEKEDFAYCTACLTSVQLEVEQKAKKGQEAVSAVRTKLLAAESEKAELAESLRRKEQLVAELELKLNNLSQELEKAVQFHAALEWLQPTLNAIAERVEALGHAQNVINEKMLQTIRAMSKKYANFSLWELIKRSLKQNLKQDA